VGIVGAVALPVAGVVVAGVQVTRGLINTGDAITEPRKGKFWDQRCRQWVDYDPAKVVAVDDPNDKGSSWYVRVAWRCIPIYFGAKHKNGRTILHVFHIFQTPQGFV
jgi:hypothetical protein